MSMATSDVNDIPAEIIAESLAAANLSPDPSAIVGDPSLLQQQQAISVSIAQSREQQEMAAMEAAISASLEETKVSVAPIPAEVIVSQVEEMGYDAEIARVAYEQVIESGATQNILEQVIEILMQQ
jgi:hypothetical protein